MPLSPEIIRSLKDKAAAEKRNSELAKEVQWEAEESDRLRADALRGEMNEINSQVKADGESQEGLRLHIENMQGKTEYHTKTNIITGLPIAQTHLQAVVLTPEGIKAFGIIHRISSSDRDQIPSFSAFDMTLEVVDIGHLLPQAEFPSAEALSQKIKTLLDILS